jgi:hypothetical protein
MANARKAPVESAQAQEVGVQMTGANDVLYEVRLDPQGKKRWYKVKIPKRVKKTPTAKPSTCEVGTEMVGVDGNMYVLKLMKDETKRWVKKSTRATKPADA